MSEIIKTIKDLAHKVSEDYLLFEKDMNESLITLVQNGSIENLEILKRICEQANQNVYLALFYDKDVDNSNIIFDIADYNKISSDAQISEEAMKDYNTPPENYRSMLEIAVIPNVTKEKSDNEKLGELNEVVEYRQSLNNLLNQIGMMKTSEINIAEDAFNKMSNDAKRLIANGESLGDIAKIASRHIKENIGGDVIKIAECYDLIHKNLSGKFHVKTGFTKISSHTINKKSKILEPVERFSMAMTKISGFAEMENNIKKVISVFNKTIKENQ